jgi:hypothetical protein
LFVVVVVFVSLSIFIVIIVVFIIVVAVVVIVVVIEVVVVIISSLSAKYSGQASSLRVRDPTGPPVRSGLRPQNIQVRHPATGWLLYQKPGQVRLAAAVAVAAAAAAATVAVARDRPVLSDAAKYLEQQQ